MGCESDRWWWKIPWRMEKKKRKGFSLSSIFVCVCVTCLFHHSNSSEEETATAAAGHERDGWERTAAVIDDVLLYTRKKEEEDERDGSYLFYYYSFAGLRIARSRYSQWRVFFFLILLNIWYTLIHMRIRIIYNRKVHTWQSILKLVTYIHKIDSMKENK